MVVITIRSDERVFSRHAGFHANRDGFLSIAEVAETTDFSLLVVHVGVDLEASADSHVVPVLIKLLFRDGRLVWQICGLEMVHSNYGRL